MKFCDDHWAKLRAAIDARGLSHLVARDGRQAVENTVLALEGRSREAMFDPLMQAHWMIVDVVTTLLGLALFNRDICPVCSGIEDNLRLQAANGPDPTTGPYTREDEERYWIEGPAEAVLKQCIASGLVKPAPPGTTA